MKRLLLLLSAFVVSFALSAQNNYYVESTGDDLNDGLSEGNAFATVGKAFTAAQAAFNASNTNFVINVGAGTFTESGLTFSEGTTANATITINGEGANATILQGSASLTESAIKLFGGVGNGSDKSLTIELNDLTAKNYGSTAGGSACIVLLSLKGTHFNANRCVFSDIQGSDGAILKTSHVNNVTINDCSFNNINGGAYPIINMTRGNITLKNSIFSNCIKDYGSSTDDNPEGVILKSKPPYNWVANTVNIINNTFVDCGIVNGGVLTTHNDTQSLIYLTNPLEGTKTTGGKINAVIANNIMIGTSLDGITSSYADINIANTGSINGGNNCINFTNSTNNILNSAITFPATGNIINGALSYTSPEVDFVMDGAELEYSTNSNGLIYVQAKGTSVIDGGLTAVQTTEDMIGTTRSEPGNVGAIEYVAPGEKQAQIITFTGVESARFSEAANINLAATASSGLAITYSSSDHSIATVVGNVLTPQGVGRVTITASQAGNESYEAASDVSVDVFFIPDNFEIFVETTGNDDNTGFDEANAFETFSMAITLAQTLFDDVVCDSFVVNIGTGTFTTAEENMFTFSNNATPVTFEFKGDGANQTMLQGGTTYPSGVRFTNTTSTNDSLSLVFKNLALDNFTNSNSGGLINLDGTDRHGVILSFDKCNISRLMARQGAFLICKSQTSISITNSYISEMETADNGWIGGAIEMQRGDLTISNCVFNGNFINRLNKTGTNRAAATIGHFQPSQGAINATIVNNTIIADSVVNSASNNKQHSAFSIVTNATNPFNATIANNIFIGGSTDNAPYSDIYFSAATNVNLTNSTNNVMNSHIGFVDVDNDSSSLYTYSSAEVNFTMDGDYPEIFTTATGVNYVKADGNSVFGTGLAAVAPDYDIAGNMRNEATPSVGAYENGVGDPTGLAKATEAQAQIYPNPVQDVLYVSEGIAQVAVYSITGQLVQSYKALNNQINVSSLSKGLYILSGLNANGTTVITERLIKD